MRGPNPKRRTGSKSDSTAEKDNSEVTSKSAPQTILLFTFFPLEVGMVRRRFEHLLVSEEIATGENIVPLFIWISLTFRNCQLNTR